MDRSNSSGTKQSSRTLSRLEQLAAEKVETIRRLVSAYTVDPVRNGSFRGAREIEALVAEYNLLSKTLKRLRMKTDNGRSPKRRSVQKAVSHQTAIRNAVVSRKSEESARLDRGRALISSLAAKRMEIRLATARVAEAEYNLCAVDSLLDELAMRSDVADCSDQYQRVEAVRQINSQAMIEYATELESLKNEERRIIAMLSDQIESAA